MIVAEMMMMMNVQHRHHGTRVASTRSNIAHHEAFKMHPPINAQHGVPTTTPLAMMTMTMIDVVSNIGNTAEKHVLRENLSRKIIGVTMMMQQRVLTMTTMLIDATVHAKSINHHQ